MNIFPQQYPSLLHMIAAESNKVDQSVPASQIRTLLEDELNFVDEKISEDESAEKF